MRQIRECDVVKRWLPNCAGALLLLSLAGCHHSYRTITKRQEAATNNIHLEQQHFSFDLHLYDGQKDSAILNASLYILPTLPIEDHFIIHSLKMTVNSDISPSMPIRLKSIRLAKLNDMGAAEVKQSVLDSASSSAKEIELADGGNYLLYFRFSVATKRKYLRKITVSVDGIAERNGIKEEFHHAIKIERYAWVNIAGN